MSSMLALQSGKVGFDYYNKDNEDNIEEYDIIYEFKEMKERHKHSYMMIKIKGNEILMDIVAPPTATYADLVANLPLNECRYVIFYMFVNELSPKLVFVLWVPDSARIKEKMIFSSGQYILKKNLVGMNMEVSATDVTEMEEEYLMEKIRRTYAPIDPQGLVHA